MDRNVLNSNVIPIVVVLSQHLTLIEHALQLHYTNCRKSDNRRGECVECLCSDTDLAGMSTKELEFQINATHVTECAMSTPRALEYRNNCSVMA